LKTSCVSVSRSLFEKCSVISLPLRGRSPSLRAFAATARSPSLPLREALRCAKPFLVPSGPACPDTNVELHHVRKLLRRYKGGIVKNRWKPLRVDHWVALCATELNGHSKAPSKGHSLPLVTEGCKSSAGGRGLPPWVCPKQHYEYRPSGDPT